MQIDKGHWSIAIGITLGIGFGVCLFYFRGSAEVRLEIQILCFGLDVVYELPERIADRIHGAEGYSR